MARLARYVIPGQPQHIIQRGNNRQVIFAANADYQFFRDVLVEAARKFSLAMHAYRECSHKGWALRGERFREQIESLGQRHPA